MSAQNDTLKPGEVKWLTDTAKSNNKNATNNSTTQNWKAKNSIFIEVWGAGGFDTPLSINYDRLLGESKWLRASIRIGRNIPVKPFNYLNTYSVLLNMNIGKNNAILELGAGWVFIYKKSSYRINGGAITGVIGFKYQRQKGGVFGRLGFTPALGYWDGGPGSFYISLYGASIGYSF